MDVITNFDRVGWMQSMEIVAAAKMIQISALLRVSRNIRYFNGMHKHSWDQSISLM